MWFWMINVAVTSQCPRLAASQSLDDSSPQFEAELHGIDTQRALRRLRARIKRDTMYFPCLFYYIYTLNANFFLSPKGAAQWSKNAIHNLHASYSLQLKFVHTPPR